MKYVALFALVVVACDSGGGRGAGSGPETDAAALSDADAPGGRDDGAVDGARPRPKAFAGTACAARARSATAMTSGP